MMRLAGLTTFVLSCWFVSGCGADRSTAPIRNVLNAMNTSAGFLESITTGLTESEKLKLKLDSAEQELGAFSGADPETKKKLDGEQKKAKTNLDNKIKDVLGQVEELKGQAKVLLDEMRRAEKEPVAEDLEERKKIARQYHGELRDTLTSLSTKRLELNKVMARIETQKTLDAKTLKDVSEKLREAEGEFENLARVQRY